MLLGWGLVGGSVGGVGFWGWEGRRDEEFGKWMKGWSCVRYSVCLEGASCLLYFSPTERFAFSFPTLHSLDQLVSYLSVYKATKIVKL